MPVPLTDAELMDAMRLIARVNGLALSEDRIARDLPAYKGLLAAIGKIDAVELPLEAEPAAIIALESERRR